jgi:NAD(P)-dependent dehydrogenase (short-subunit alcohol dehydrogenase family)
MDLGLKGKVALITGGSEGIGKATARILTQEGAKVAIAARRPEVLAQAAAEIGGETLAIAADVTSPADIERMVAETVARFGRLDIVVNNAGVALAKPFMDATDDDWTSDIDLKLFGAIRVSRAAIPHLRKSGGGRIINITTVGGKQPGARSGPTSISRAAGIALTKALSKEFAPENILVNTVCVGILKAAQHEAAAKARGGSVEDFYEGVAKNTPLGRVGETDEAAKVIVFLASEAASYVTGASINVDGGTSAVV